MVIGIGSSQHSHTPRNPLDVGERMEMIVRALRGENFPLRRISIVPIPDTESPNENWGKIVLDRVPRIDMAFSNDFETMRDLQAVGIKVEGIPFYRREDLSATRIRTLILKGDSLWRDLVPPSVLSFLDELNFEKRIKKICSDPKRTP